jgi:predicted nucleotidyltransferase
MKLPQDSREFLELFNAKGVEYMIVGSYALAYYGARRYTGDIDLFVRRTEVNAQRIIKKASGRAKDVADIEALGERIPPNQSA